VKLDNANSAAIATDISDRIAAHRNA